jgi:hypothetical protein
LTYIGGGASHYAYIWLRKNGVDVSELIPKEVKPFLKQLKSFSANK